MPITLHYFDIPGRAETARLLLTLGGVNFVDRRSPVSSWPAIKPSMPFHQVPVLELEDGRMLAQMAAIDRYCAAITGVLPADPLVLADIEQAYFFIEDVFQPLHPAIALERNSDATAEEKAQAYEELLQPDGLFKQRLGLLEKWLTKRWEAGSGRFLAGQQLTHVDLALYATLRPGYIPGLPRDVLGAFSTLSAFQAAVAAVPAVAAFYAKAAKGSDDVRPEV